MRDKKGRRLKNDFVIGRIKKNKIHLVHHCKLPSPFLGRMLCYRKILKKI